MAPASPVLPTVTAHRVGSLCVLALRDTTELLGTLQKWPVLVSLMLLFLRVELVVWCLVWCGGVGLGVGVMGQGGHQMFLAT